MRFTELASWWVQRLSAVYMLAFVLFLVATFALDPLHDYAQWRAMGASSPGKPNLRSATVERPPTHGNPPWPSLCDLRSSSRAFVLARW
jgi:hypothetical protein